MVDLPVKRHGWEGTVPAELGLSVRPALEDNSLKYMKENFLEEKSGQVGKTTRPIFLA